jgi:uncharacterized phage infection (PIP) family protein YhgE
LPDLTIPARVNGTAALRDVMDAVASELRVAAQQANELRRYLNVAMHEALTASGVSDGQAATLVEGVSADLRALDESLNATAHFASQVSQRADAIKTIGARAAQLRDRAAAV